MHSKLIELAANFNTAPLKSTSRCKYTIAISLIFHLILKSSCRSTPATRISWCSSSSVEMSCSPKRTMRLVEWKPINFLLRPFHFWIKKAFYIRCWKTTMSCRQDMPRCYQWPTCFAVSNIIFANNTMFCLIYT